MTTRECSSIQEHRIASKLGGVSNSSSGSGHFNKSDVVVGTADLVVECKTCMSPKSSFSIKKDWIEKLKQETFSMGKSNSVIAFNFYYEDGKDYYVIDDNLMRFLVDKLKEENS